MADYANPAISDFQGFFARDFVYGDTTSTVMNADIQTGINDASVFINPNFFSNQTNYTTGFLYLAAHFMVMNLLAASQSVSAQFPWMQSSKGVGSVSESFTIAQRILDNPELALLSKTYYGAKYLILILPQLTGQMYVVSGRTNP